MENKGFTLIELLAVIVILAIIALIAVPIILNIIDSSKTSANERSKELYLDAVEQAIARKNLTGEYNPTECTVNGTGNLDCKNEEGNLPELTVETTGAKPNEGGTITLQNGKVTENTLVFGDNSSGGNKEEASKICQLASDSEKQGYEIGAKYTCSLDKDRTFYVLETTEEKVSLLMEQNFTDGDGTNGTIPPTVAWCTDGGSDNTTCKNINTTGSDAPEGKDYIGHIAGVFNKGVKVSFPTKEQIEGIGCTSTIGSCPEWACDYLDKSPNSVSGVQGYWTSTLLPNNSIMAPLVDYNSNTLFGTGGREGLASVSSASTGLRPVITISKADLS